MLRKLIDEELAFLSFQPVGAVVAERWRAFLAFGLVCTWLAGVGRYWDNPRAALWQHLGLGSLAYVFALSLVLWLVVLPLRPRRWSYRNVLLFVSMTAPPALLYAIPVERFVPLATAATLNGWFLAIVAAWRVALLFAFLRHVAGLRWFPVVVAALLPLALIVVVLAALNLEHATFQLMAGLHDDVAPTAADRAYEVVFLLTAFAFAASPLLVIFYLACVIVACLESRALAYDSRSAAGRVDEETRR